MLRPPERLHLRAPRRRWAPFRRICLVMTVGLAMTAIARVESRGRRPVQRSGRGAARSADAAPDPATAYVDLSGLHNLVGTPMWEDAIRSYILGHQSVLESASATTQKDDAAVVTIDVSQSAVRDDHFDSMLRILFPLDNDDGPSNARRTGNGNSMSDEATMRLQVIAYGNQLTGGAVLTLVERILLYEDHRNSSRHDSNVTGSAAENRTMSLSIEGDMVSSNDETISSHADATESPRIVRRQLQCLDLSWNSLFLTEDDAPMPHKKRRTGASGTQLDRRPRSVKEAMQRLVALRTLTTLRLDCCGLDPAHCRSLAKGLLDRYPPLASSKASSDAALSHQSDASSDLPPCPFSLHLSGNGAVGDAGAAALAAALRTLVRRHHKSESSSSSSSSAAAAVVLDTLDLSRCGIGDVGAEALAVALEARRRREGGPALVIRRLDLSHNRITSTGAAALGRALRSVPPTEAATTAACDVQLLGLDLSDNKDVGDKGAAEIAAAVATGRLPCVSMRSCNMYADGAAAFGKALRRAALVGASHDIDVDLSGNPLGVLRGKKKEDNKYSASRLKSKASATAASYVNQGMSFLRKNLKDVGVDVAPIFGTSSAESDDEEEKGAEESVDDDYDPTKGRCGAKAMANGFIEAPDEERSGSTLPASARIKVGLRHCSFDHGAADALAAMLVEARKKLKLQLDVDIRLNSILEEEMVSALEGSVDFEHLLLEMAERHQDAVDALKEARVRAAQASASAAARVRSRDDEDEADWETVGVGATYDDDERDSDADYEDED